MSTNPLDRRDFLKLGAAGFAVAGLPGVAGCAAPPDREPPLELSRRASDAGNVVDTFSIHAPIQPGSLGDLKAALAKQAVFASDYPGIHFARIVLLEREQQLVLAVIYDRSRRTAINFLVENGERLDPVLDFCVGYALGDALDPVRLNAFLEKHLVPNKLFFTAYNTAEGAVRESLVVRESFLAFLRDADRLPEAQLPYRFDRFLLASNVPNLGVDAPRPKRAPGGVPFQPHLTNTLTMVQPLMRGRIERDKLVPGSHSRLMEIERLFGPLTTYKEFFELILKEGEFAVRDLHKHPLAQLHTLHFARVAVIEGDKMLFSSVYDGDFTQYVLDFGSRVADEIDALWGLTENYPAAGSRDVLRFIEWIRRGQVSVESFYSAHGDVTLLEIQAATQLQKSLQAFAARGLPVKPAALSAELRAFVRENQALLG